MAKKKKNATRRLFILIGVLVGLIVVLGIVVSATGLVGSGERPIEVEIETVEIRSITQVVTASGKMQPEIEVAISPDVSGEIIELPVLEGDAVARGMLLARIKPDFYQAQVEQADAAVLQSKANEAQRRADLANAEFELNKQEKLYESKAISETEYMAAKTRFETSKAAHEAAQYSVKINEARLSESLEQLSKTTIYAPMDGTISMLNVELGERVVGANLMAGTEMMRVARLDQMELEVDVNENDVVNISVGDTAAVEIDAYPERIFRGRVTEIANSARIQGGGTSEQITNFPVKIRIMDPHNVSFEAEAERDVVSTLEIPVQAAQTPNFRPGMSGTVDVFTETLRATISVPIQAVTVRDFNAIDDEEYGERDTENEDASEEADAEEDLRRVVFLMVDERAQMVEVETGIQDDTYIAILSGVSEGESVVVGPYRAVSRTLEPNDLLKEKEEERRRRNPESRS